MARRYRPSGANEWASCPGTLTFWGDLKRPSGPEAREGQLAHGWVIERKGTRLPEYHESERLWALAISDIFGGVSEVKLSWNGIEGTPDYVGFLDRPVTTVCIVDFKYGYGLVSPSSWQLKVYGAMAVEAMSKPIQEVELRVVQPRGRHPDGPIRVVKYNVQELVAEVADAMRAATEVTQAGDVELCVGKHCRYCPALHACPSAWQHVSMMVDLADNTQFDGSTTIDEMVTKYRVIRDGIKRVEAVRDALYDEIVAHKGPLPGMEVRQGRRLQKWAIDPKTLKFLFGASVVTEKAISPAAAKQMGLDVSKFVETYNAKSALVDVDHGKTFGDFV